MGSDPEGYLGSDAGGCSGSQRRSGDEIEPSISESSLAGAERSRSGSERLGSGSGSGSGSSGSNASCSPPESDDNSD